MTKWMQVFGMNNEFKNFRIVQRHLGLGVTKQTGVGDLGVPKKSPTFLLVNGLFSLRLIWSAIFGATFNLVTCVRLS